MYKITSLFRNRKYLKSILPCTTMATDNGWKGVPITHIIGSQSPWGAPEFPLVQPGFNHAVLYHIPGSGTQLDRPPKPQIGQHKWDQEHVRMPFSKNSLYPVPNDSGETDLKSRWQMIQEALNKPIQNSKELAETILSYNSQFKDKWRFSSLHQLFESLDEDESQYFFDVTLPEIVKLALALPKLIQAPIPLLKQHKNRSVSLSQQQISSLLANAFFCTFPRRNTHKKDAEYSTYPFINFNATVPVGVVTFSRRSVQPRALPDWASSAKPLAELPVHVDPQDTIENAHGLIQVDFANKFLGGGVLGYGCVQEEIRFVICPELMISMLFTECLRPNEALMMIGCEQYSTYTGYGHSFQWSGDHSDRAPHDSSARRRCAVLAVDALPFRTALQEHRRDAVTRELNKAWVGFSFYTGDEPGPHYPGVATGNWGCGAFGGTAPLKSLVQMAALAQAGRPMAYYTFGDVALRDNIIRAHTVLVKHGVTVGGLYGLILDYCKTDVLKCDVYTFLEKVLDGKDSSSTLCDTSTSTEPETMDYNAETEQYDTSLTIEQGLDGSPDLFDDDDALYMIPANLSANVKNDNCQKETNNPDNMAASEHKLSTSSKEMADVDHKMANNDHKMANNDHKMANNEHKMADSDHKMANNEHRMADSDHKTRGSNKMAYTDHETPTCSNKKSDHRMSISPGDATEKSKTFHHTSRLFDEMEKLDKSSGKLNFNSPQNSIFGQKCKQIEIPDNSNTLQQTITSSDEIEKLDESSGRLHLKSPSNSIFRQKCKQTDITENSKTSNQTSKLLDDIGKLDDDSGKLNLKSPQKPLFVQKSKHESAMDVEDKILSEISTEVKKKLTRKITDYFSKKPI